MKIVMLDRLVKTDSGYFKPFTRYVISDFELNVLLEGTPNTNWKWSSFNAWNRPCGGRDLNGKSLLIYRHNAWGDQLIASAIPRYLKTLYPYSKIHMYCHPEVLPLWLGNVFLEGSAIPLPIPFEATQRYDCHAFFEGMLEGNSEPDQNCCYDDFFGTMGYLDVPAKFKKPYILPQPEDYADCDKMMKKLGITSKAPYMVYHISPANKNRCYPPQKGLAFLKMFKEQYPEMSVYVVGYDPKGEYTIALNELACYNLLGKTETFRTLVPIVERASLLVCPDSSIMHLAAAFDVPTISLWGLFHPNDRAKYYVNHYPIFHGTEACPYSPCRDRNFQLPLVNCKDAWPSRKREGIEYCFGLSKIEPEEIMTLVERVINETHIETRKKKGL